MIRLVWIDKETKAWGASEWTTDVYKSALESHAGWLKWDLPQYEYYIEGRAR